MGAVMHPIKTAITLLQVAREYIETDAYQRGIGDPNREDLDDVAATIGELLYVLESFGKPKEGEL